MNLYERQKSIKLNVNQTFSVIGCGGIGYWVAKYLAMSGVEKLHIFDDDVLEEHNLNRLDVPLKFLGRNKADITKMVISNLRPNCTVYSYPFKFNETHGSMVNTDFLIDCTDKFESQETNQNVAKRHNMNYIKAGYDGTHISISDSVAEWGEATDGYQIVPSWVVPASVVAALTVAKVLKYYDEKKELSCHISHLFKIVC